MFVFRIVAFCLMLALMPAISLAATIFVIEPETAARSARIAIEGELKPGDETIFSNVAIQLNKAIVLFSVENGDLPTMLKIGQTIQLKHFETLVVEDSDCAAVCALGWLSGAKNYFQRGALINFGGATSGDGTRPLVESYLEKLAIPAAVSQYIMQSDPVTENWLTAEAALLKGFEISVLEEALIAEPEPEVEPAVAVEVPPPPPKPAPQPLPRKNFQTVAGLDLFGYDLPGMPMRESTWESCSIACSAARSCKAFTYNNKSRTCFLKSHADFAVHYEPASSGVIASLVRGIKQSSINIIQKTDIVGGDYNSVDNVNMETCLRTCDADSACAGFSFIAKKRQCWLKSGISETIAKPGVVSGVK